MGPLAGEETRQQYRSFREAVGAIGEVLGALAVVATLLYLALQVRHAKAAAADASRQTRSAGIQAMLLAMATNDDLRNAVAATGGLDANNCVHKLVQEFGISPDEAGRVEWQAAYWFWLHWGHFASTTSEEDIAELRHLIGALYSSPYMLFCWQHSDSARPYLDPEFVAFVDSILIENGSLARDALTSTE